MLRDACRAYSSTGSPAREAGDALISDSVRWKDDPMRVARSI